MSLLEDKDIEAWLSECRTQSTRQIYTYGANLFFGWLQKEKGLGLEQFKVLSIREMKTLVLQYQNSSPLGMGHKFTRKHLSPKPLSRNAISGILTAVQSFCMYLEKPLLLKGKKLDREDDTHSHYFQEITDLTRMFDVSNLKGKAILATAASLGWGMIDFLALKRGFIEDHLKKAQAEGRDYVFFETKRIKTRVPVLGVLNPLAIKCLREWLPMNPTDTVFDMTKSGLVKFMHTTARKANLATTGSVRFHRIRAWLFNKLQTIGFSEFEAKYIVGKGIPHGDSTYLRLRQGIEEKYPKLYGEYLDISGRGGRRFSDEDREVLDLLKTPGFKEWLLQKAKSELGVMAKT